MRAYIGFALAGAIIGLGHAFSATAAERVTVDSFRRAETDLYISRFVADGAFGSFVHEREPVPINEHDVIRLNRDTLYSFGVADPAAGPATVTLPPTDGRFMSLLVINEDHYTPTVVYEAGEHTFEASQMGTRRRTPVTSA